MAFVESIGQSSCGGCLNNNSSCSSAALFLHSFLCCGRWTIWHSLLQYFTILHAAHDLRLILDSSPLPQLAHVILVILVDIILGDVFGSYSRLLPRIKLSPYTTTIIWFLSTRYNTNTLFTWDNCIPNNLDNYNEGQERCTNLQKDVLCLMFSK